MTASIDNVILDKDVQFDDEYRERLEQLLDLFEGEYTFEKYTEEDIRKTLKWIFLNLQQTEKIY